MMKLSDEQIQKLIDWFVKFSETKRKWSEGRRSALKENHQWIQPQTIQQMSDSELETKFLDYYKNGGGRQSFNQIFKNRIIRDINRFRKTLLYLLDENVDITQRMNDVLDNLDGEYRIKGMGKALVTSFLMDFNPERYCLWNSKTVLGFFAIGWDVYQASEPSGTAYEKVMAALQKLKNLRPEYNLNFDDIDLFLYTISADEEGKKAIEAVRNGREILMPTVGEKEQIPSEVESMEFPLEKHLEEFIEKKFNGINFDANLELYQTEESSGRQYQTTVGKIDLLAVDNQRREFVVIELKKGKASDDVVGQILRYMAWVKENLAVKDYGNYTVRGIIIAKEMDYKLEYALKQVQNVEFFKYKYTYTYTYTFDLERHSANSQLC